MRGRIKGATWGHIWHIHHIAVTVGSIAESGMYIFNHKGVYCWVRGVYLAIQNCSTEKWKFFVFAMEWSILPSPHYESHCQHYRAPILYSLLPQQPKHHINFPGNLWSNTVLTWCVEPRTADADDNFARQAVDPGIALGPVVFDESLPPVPAELWGWAFYCQLKSLFHDRQLPRAAR